MWILYAILARGLWAVTNAIDQTLARAHPRHVAMSALTMEYVTRLPLALAGYFVLGSFPHNANLLIYSCAGILGVTLALVPYYATLKHEHAHNVTPYMEITPVCLIGIAYIFKGEVLTPIQFLGAFIVITSGFLFSWDFARSHFKIRVFLMLAAASIFFALGQYYMSQAESFGSILAVCCHFYFFSSLLGFLFLLAMQNMRKTFLKTIIQTRGATLYLGLATNIVGLVALAALLLAFRLAPTIGHVGGLSGSQPIFSFLLAIPLAKFFPKYFSKITFDRETRVKMILILSIALGVYLLATH